MEKEILNTFIDKPVKLKKDDNFIIWGVIQGIYNDGILFFTDGKTIFLSFSSIKEITPMRRDKE